MPEHITQGERRAAKAHQCFDCYRAIPKGARYYFFVGKSDGSVYTLRSHIDCREAAIDYLADGYEPDYYEGIPPLADMMRDSGQFHEECGAMRGHFPHVVARLELTEQMAEIRWRDHPHGLTQPA